MTNPKQRSARTLSESLGELFATRGYGRLRSARELESAWNTAVGETIGRYTRIGEVKKEILHVTVAHSTLLEELVAFRKPAILAALRQGAPATPIRDIRFRVGPMDIAT